MFVKPRNFYYKVEQNIERNKDYSLDSGKRRKETYVIQKVIEEM